MATIRAVWRLVQLLGEKTRVVKIYLAQPLGFGERVRIHPQTPIAGPPFRPHFFLTQASRGGGYSPFEKRVGRQAET
jgi:hypothetical protein